MTTTKSCITATILGALWLTGCLGPVKEMYPEKEEGRPHSVYIIRPGWHVGVAFNGEYLREKLPHHERIPQEEYLMVGWGDNKYYPADRAGIGLFLRAAFLPTGSVIHVTGFNQAPDSYFRESGIVKIQISDRGLEAMTEYIAGQFSYNTDEQLQFIGDGLYPKSAFFKARGIYMFPKTSNKWAARVLRNSGFPITPFYAVTSGNVMHQAGKEGVVLR